MMELHNVLPKSILFIEGFLDIAVYSDEKKCFARSKLHLGIYYIILYIIHST